MFDIGSARRRRLSLAASDSGNQLPEQQHNTEAPDWRGQLELIDIEVLRRLRAYPSDIAWDDLYATFGSEPVMRDNLVHAVQRLADRQWHLVQIDEQRVGLTLAGRLAADQLGAGLSPLDYRRRAPSFEITGEGGAEFEATPVIEIDSDAIQPAWGALAGPFPDYISSEPLVSGEAQAPWDDEIAPSAAEMPAAAQAEAVAGGEATAAEETAVAAEPIGGVPDVSVSARDKNVSEPVAQALTVPDNVRVFPDTPQTSSGQNTYDDRRAKVQMDVQQVTFIPGASGGEVQADVSSGRRKLVASWPLEGDESGLQPLLDKLMVKIEQVAFIPTPMGGQVRAELRVGEQTFVSTCWIDGQNTATQEAMQSLCQVVEEELLQAFTPGSASSSKAADEVIDAHETISTFETATPSWSPSAQ